MRRPRRQVARRLSLGLSPWQVAGEELAVAGRPDARAGEVEGVPGLDARADLLQVGGSAVLPSLTATFAPAAIEVGAVELATGAAARGLAATDVLSPQEARQRRCLTHQIASFQTTTRGSLPGGNVSTCLSLHRLLYLLNNTEARGRVLTGAGLPPRASQLLLPSITGRT